MSKVTMSSTTVQDTKELSMNLRHADRLEVEAISGMPGEYVVFDSVDNSSRCWTCKSDEGVVAILGVVPCGKIPEGETYGLAWMLTTDLVKKHTRDLLDLPSTYVPLMFGDDIDILSNCVDARNTRAIRWLRWAGFEFQAPINYPDMNNLTVIPFTKYRGDYPAIIGVVIAVASAAASAAAQAKAARAADAAAQADYQNKVAAMAEQTAQIEEAATEDVSDRARQQRREASSLRVAAGESGVGGLSVEGLIDDTRVQAGFDTARVEKNKQNQLDQTHRSLQGIRSQTVSKVNNIKLPNYVGTALQIGGSVAGGIASQNATDAKLLST